MTALLLALIFLAAAVIAPRMAGVNHGCCCGCVDYSGETTLSVTFSGFSTSQNCVVCGFNEWCHDQAGSPTGPYTLTKSGSEWHGAVGSLVIQEFSTSDCSGSPTGDKGPVTIDLIAGTLFCSGGRFAFTCIPSTASNTGTGGGTATLTA